MRDIRLIVGAVGLSAIGDGLLWLLLSFHIGATTDSAFAVAALFVCLWGPVVVLGGVAGRIVDTHENRRLLIGVSLAQAAVVVAMAFSTGSLPVLLGLCLLLGSGVAVASPAEFALVPAAAGEARVAQANGHVEAARYLGMTAGPLLGGLLAGAGGTQVGLLIDAASFLAVAGAGIALHARRDPQATRRAAKAEGGGREVLLADRTLAVTLTAAVGALLFFTISVTADPFFATDVLGTGATGYGVLMTAWMLGMVAGAVGLARLIPARWLAVGALAGVAVQGAGMLGAAVGATMALALAGFLVGGLAHGTKNVLLRTLIHERVPEASRGRAFAAYNAARNGAELAALGAGGVIVGLAGAQLALAVAGAVPLGIGVVTLLVITAPATRRRPVYA
ncbi:MAG TPA: MFS transporter [Solirubrobacteraceae bacterium]|nr:MFS transporter [Solirubrobacteraceae bacterium]